MVGSGRQWSAVIGGDRRRLPTLRTEGGPVSCCQDDLGCHRMLVFRGHDLLGLDIMPCCYI